MKLSTILLFAATAISLNANANAPSGSNATCAHGDKSAWVGNKNADLAKVAMIYGTQTKTPAPTPSTNSKGTN